MTEEKYKIPNTEFEVELYYLTENEGGRKHYVTSGYRGQFYYNKRDWDAAQEFIDKEICNPGEIVQARFVTLSSDFHVGQFYIGKEFEIREGARTVARGKTTKILRPDFNYWNFTSFFDKLPKDCKPYDSKNIGGFIADFEYRLNTISQINSLKFTKSLSNKTQMLIIECDVKDKSSNPRPLIDEICKIWREEVQLEKAHSKIDLTYFDNHFNFEFTFATWYSMYLTGKIIVNTK